jgi:hypothetical protein
LQIVNEFRVALLVGRVLCFPVDSVGLTVSLVRMIQYRDANDGSIAELQVNLLFPATERSVLRLVQAWWDAKVSCCP